MAVEAGHRRGPSASPAALDRPAVIEVRNVSKAFHMPTQRVDSIKERVLHPFQNRQVRDLQALRDVSFDVRQGEFFGIVGRNGSGKSTLLKILASIYQIDSGSVRMAGIPAPFIELGVGFNPELTARENVALNGVMMGLSRQEAKRRLGLVLEFAELEEFVDMKLKNYSSGMLVRLAFSVMIQSDSDILLIDEVLAVGDASFQQKCADVFHEIRDSRRTMVLVTHDMSAVEHYCHRAMLLDEGRIVEQGEPDEVARNYLRLNFEQAGGEHETGGDGAAGIRVIEAWLEQPQGSRTGNVEHGRKMTLNAVFEARRDITGPTFGFMLTNADHVDVIGFGTELPDEWDGDVLEAGQRVHVSGTVENRLAPGRYVVKSWVHQEHSYSNLVLHTPHLFDFVVFGAKAIPGVMSADAEVGIRLEEDSREH